jgi:subtilisin family serine protease
MKLLRCTLALVAWSLAASVTSAAIVTPDLARRASALSAGQEVPIIVRFDEHVKLGDFKSGRAGAPGLISSLRAVAGRSQVGALALLKARGRAGRAKVLWIDNSLALSVPADLLDELAGLPGVESISYDEPVVMGDAELGPAEFNGLDWGLSKIRAPEVWSVLGYDGSGVVIGSIDSGADITHPALQGKWRGGSNSWIDLVNGQPTPYDDHGHGTHTIGTMVGGDGAGPFTSDIGVAYGAKFISARIFDASGSFSSNSVVTAAAQWMLDPDGNPATNDFPQVINNSWGFFDLAYTGFHHSVEVWRAAGIIPVFSIGNSGPGSATTGAPGNYDNVIGVGATDSGDGIAWFSSRGPAPTGTGFPSDRRKPDLGAPGVSIVSCVPGGGYQAWSGTSMASPHVTGTVALMLQAHPGITFDQIRAALLASAVDLGIPGYDDDFGYGRLDALGALSATLCTVSGHVRTAGGSGISGVLMFGLPGGPVTDTSGYYTAFAGSGWSGTVTPRRTGCVFSPDSTIYTNVTTNLTTDYTGVLPTIKIYGYTLTPTGGAIPGVTLNGLPGPPVTDEYGGYESYVAVGWSGTVTPTRPGYSFYPVSQQYINVQTNQWRNYSGTLQSRTISGHVLSVGGGGIADVVMRGLPGAPATDTDGHYAAVVSYGWSGTVQPTAACFRFDPGVVAYGAVTSDTTTDYTGSASFPDSLQVRFGSRTDYPTPPQPAAIAVGDLNRDGHAEVVVADRGAALVSVFTGNGDGTLGTRRDYATGDGPVSVALGDVDGDGRLDVVTADFDANTVSILRGNGDGTLGARTALAVGARPRGVAIADLDGDGRSDIVTAEQGADSVLVLLNLVGGWSRAVYPTGGGPGPVAVARLDGDDWPDVVVADSSSGSVSVLLGSGGGALGARADYATGGQPVAIAIEDANHDGWRDVMVASRGSDVVSVFLGAASGTGVLGPGANFATGARPCGLAAGDLRGVGTLVLVTADFDADSISVLLGDCAGGHSPRTAWAVGHQPGAVVLADLDGDWLPEAIVANTGSNTVSVLRNVTSRVADVPAGPPVSGLALGPVNPNPNSGPARIDFALPQACRVRLAVYDVAGREVAVLADGLLSAGRHAATWDGRTARGSAPTGLYFVRLAAGGRVLSQRLVRLQ